MFSVCYSYFPLLLFTNLSLLTAANARSHLNRMGNKQIVGRECSSTGSRGFGWPPGKWIHKQGGLPKPKLQAKRNQERKKIKRRIATTKINWVIDYNNCICNKNK